MKNKKNNVVFSIQKTPLGQVLAIDILLEY